MKNNSNDRDRKRDRFAGASAPAKPSGRRLVLVIGIALAVVAVGVVAAVLAMPRLRTPSTPTIVGGPAPLAATLGREPYPEVLADAGTIRLVAATFADGQARHYTYMHEGQPIEFFVVQSGDGVIRAAFNACDTCYRGRRGYVQDGDEMICVLCGLRFPIAQINTVQGGCNPAALRRTIVGDLVVIQVADLVAGARLF